MKNNDRGAALISTFQPPAGNREAKGGTAEGLLGFLPEGCPGSAEKICRTAIVKTMERYHGTTKGAGAPYLCLFAMDLLRVHGFFNK